jgi:CubicO group peptidase (beta-lactamase class C family)
MGRFAVSRRKLIKGAALAGAGTALPGLLAGCGEAPDSLESWPATAALLKEWVDSGRVSGMVATVGRGEGAPLVMAEGLDRMEGERASDGDSLYRIYSMTKPIAGMAAMILVHEGKISLDQPIGEILPEFAEMQVLKDVNGPIDASNLEPAVRPITIRHLLTHTSGLTYAGSAGPALQEAMRSAGLNPGQVGKNLPEAFAEVDPVEGLDEFADRLAKLPLISQPGATFIYSPALDVLGRVIEVVSGQSFDAFLQERLFDPVGMSSTFFTVPASELGRLTTTYGNNEGEVLVLDPAEDSVFAEPRPFPMGGSGLVSSPNDYDRFLHMLGNGGEIDGVRVMAAEAVSMGMSDLLPDTADNTGTSVEGYGYGAGGRIGWAGMDKAYGWAGSAATVGFVDPVSGLRAGLYTQYRSIPGLLIHLEFEPVIESDLAFQHG